MKSFLSMYSDYVIEELKDRIDIVEIKKGEDYLTVKTTDMFIMVSKVSAWYYIVVASLETFEPAKGEPIFLSDDQTCLEGSIIETLFDSIERIGWLLEVTKEHIGKGNTIESLIEDIDNYRFYD